MHAIVWRLLQWCVGLTYLIKGLEFKASSPSTASLVWQQYQESKEGSGSRLIARGMNQGKQCPKFS